MKTISRFSLLLALMCLSLPVWGERACGNYDGDTITLCKAKTVNGHTSTKVRMLDIDALELDQPYGPQAQKYLALLITGTDLRLECTGVDKYKRLLCTVWDENKSINAMLVAHGYAFCYLSRRYTKFEVIAKQFRLGAWGLTPVPPMPWDWRKEKKDRYGRDTD